MYPVSVSNVFNANTTNSVLVDLVWHPRAGIHLLDVKVTVTTDAQAIRNLEATSYVEVLAP